MGLITNVCRLAQALVVKHPHKVTALDGTLGNGVDSDFLAEHFERVFAFDIQAEAIEAYAAKQVANVSLFQHCHSQIQKFVAEPLDCAMFNLGYLPGSSSEIATQPESSMQALQQTMDLLKPGGMMTVAIYVGHELGRQELSRILAFAQTLPPRRWSVMNHVVVNRQQPAPQLLVFEKR